jgi:hypothetical protein
MYLWATLLVFIISYISVTIFPLVVYKYQNKKYGTELRRIPLSIWIATLPPSPVGLRPLSFFE